MSNDTTPRPSSTSDILRVSKHIKQQHIYDYASHAFVVWFCGTALVSLIIVFLGNLYDPVSPELSARFQEKWATLGWGLLAYYLLLLLGRFVDSGTHNVYEMLWLCNVSLFLSIVGFTTGRPILVGAACAAVAIDQLCWYVDVLGYAVSGKMPVGAASYILWPHTTTVKKVTATHHLWFIPLCLYTLIGFGGLRANSWLLSCVLTTLLSVVCRSATPKWLSLPGDPKPVYLNINLGYEMWVDIKVPFMHWLDRASSLLYLPYVSLIGNCLLNPLPYLFLRAVSHRLDAAYGAK